MRSMRCWISTLNKWCSRHRSGPVSVQTSLPAWPVATRCSRSSSTLPKCCRWTTSVTSALLSRRLAEMSGLLKMPVLSESEFRHDQQLMAEASGIHMAPSKRPLVAGRLMKRLRHYRLDSYAEYLHLLDQPVMAQALHQATRHQRAF